MTKYYINDEETEKGDFFQQLDTDTVEECEGGAYDDILNEGDMVSVGGCEYSPADVLKNVDPTAYRCGLVDYADGIREDYTNELERGDTLTINGNTYEIREEEQENEI